MICTFAFLSHRPRHPITHILPGRLGLHLHPQQHQQDVNQQQRQRRTSRVQQPPPQQQSLPQGGPSLQSCSTSYYTEYEDNSAFLALGSDGSVLHVEVTEQEWAREALAHQVGIGLIWLVKNLACT
jgi:hypothetical protein